VLILSTVLLLWVCFVRLFDVIKEQTVAYHSLDGATSFSKVDSNKLQFNVKNEMTLIFFAKFDTGLINISKVTSCKTKWPRFLAYLVLPVGLSVRCRAGEQRRRS